MEETKKHIDEWIVSFLSGELGRKETEELKVWMAQSEENRAYFMHCQELWFSASQDEEAQCYDAERAFRQFQARVSSCRAKRIVGQKTWNRHLWIRYAAVVALLGLVAYFSYRQGESKIKNVLTDIEVQAPLGAQTRMRLPDSTWVVLNAGSRVVYGQGFGVDSREVFLEGEGYFEVTPDVENPFYVRSKSLQVRVVGTKFNFRDYPEDEQVVVSLLEGKLLLNNRLRKQADCLLMPDERIVLNKTDGMWKLESTRQVVTDVAWKNGVLSFDEILLPEVIKVLERCYDVQITLATDSLASYRFYGNFSRTEQSIKDILEALQATGKIHYTLNGKNAVLY